MSSVKKVAGIILAAGLSSRMGCAKQLLPFRGQTVLECVVDSALRSSLHPVIVVLGHEADLIGSLLSGKDVMLVCNPHYESGQSSSIQSGLGKIKSEVDAALFLLADQPLINPDIINSILAAYEQNQNAIVLPTFNGKRGNPVLFDRQTFQRFDALSGNSGARILFSEYSEQILKVPVSDSSIHFDIDTEQDYRDLCKFDEGVPFNSSEMGSKRVFCRTA